MNIFSRNTSLEAAQYRTFARVGLAIVFDAPMPILRLVQAQVSCKLGLCFKVIDLYYQLYPAE